MAVLPPRDELRSVLALAARAPSVHNCQPWRWLVAEHSVQLLLDRSRLPAALDPAGRELVSSCGAVLHHARVAFAAAGWRTSVQRIPNPAHPDHLASLQFCPTAGAPPGAAALARAAARRCTDRRPYSVDPVSDEAIEALRHTAEAERCTLVVAEDEARRTLVAALERGARWRGSAEYRAELARWNHQGGGEPEPPEPVLSDRAVLAVLVTRGDGVGSWLAAGEALSAVLLVAARDGLSACALGQLAECAESRLRVRELLLDGAGHPHLAVRVGHPSPGAAGPGTRRRELSDTLRYLCTPRST
ncbi:nitroreductase family protein [Saccharopolyspora rosea]|uniref:Nitroreductase family protein n=1 Tax=Saccharopolyspora rosea TaxID=524884 RepID=A0ABW3FWM6_9PSEU|nr:nitroreductase family protein [Saccharopolyspora rosea]